MKIYEQYVRVGELGVPELCPFDYIDFYEANIHPYNILYLEEGEHKVYEGITAKDFHLQHKEGFLDIVQPLLQDERLSQLQDDLEKEGKQVCMFNMYLLAMFLVKRAKTRYVFLLKPKISDILATLNNVSKLAFTNGDETIIKSTSSKLIKIVMEALEEKKDFDSSDIEVEKMVTWDEISNKSVMQSYFINDLTLFLSKYFPVKRRKDALISTKEVELVLYLMKLFGLSTAILTNKRYWQLMNLYKQINSQPQNFGRFKLEGEEYIMPITFIPYSIWNNGKVDWTLEELPELQLKGGDTIQF